MATSRLCTIPDCGKPYWARGWCRVHHYRWLRHGDPLSGRTAPNPGLSCIIPGCGKPRIARGWCIAHYKRWWRGGDLLGKGHRPAGEIAAYVETVVLTYRGDECLIWPYTRNNGYGRMRRGTQSVAVHRVVCEAINGPPPTPSHQAAHSCGRGRFGCVSPSHLRWATASENAQERLQHGTASRGEQNGYHKLTEEQVREIRRLAGTISQTKIANRFAVTQATVSSIIRRRIWSWLT